MLELRVNSSTETQSCHWCILAASSEGHTNKILAELKAMMKGVNLALEWDTTKMHLFTESACVHWWVPNMLMANARMHTKAANEMLIRRCLNILEKLVNEYELPVDVMLVRSDQNQTDRLISPTKMARCSKKLDPLVLHQWMQLILS